MLQTITTVNEKMLSHHVPSSFDEEVVELSDGDHGLHPDELLLFVHEQDVRHVHANLKNIFQRVNPIAFIQ